MVPQACIYPRRLTTFSSSEPQVEENQERKTMAFLSFLFWCMCVYMCVCILNVCGPTYVWRCMPTCNQVWRPDTEIVFLNYSPFSVLLQSLSLNADLIKVANSQLGVGIPCLHLLSSGILGKTPCSL